MGFRGVALGLQLKVIQVGKCEVRGDGERNPAAAGWLVRAGGRLKFRGHLRREESLRQNRNPRRSTVRMCKECLMCILCPCSLFFGPDCRKNLLRESRFCLRLSTHSSGIVPELKPSSRPTQPARCRRIPLTWVWRSSRGLAIYPKHRVINSGKQEEKCYNVRPSPPVFRGM